MIAVYIVTRGMIEGSNSLRARDFFEMSRPALDPIQPHVQWAWGSFLGGLFGWDMKLTTHVLLVLRLRASGAVLLLLLYAFLVWTGTILSPTFTS